MPQLENPPLAHEISEHCPACARRGTRRFLYRQAVPVHQNLVCPKSDDAHRLARGELAMRVCEACGFVFNALFNPALLSYHQGYDNTQSHSATFQKHVSQLVQRIVEKHGIRNSTIVEIGCGKGDFLRQLVAAPGTGNRGIGFDPTYAGAETDLDGRLQFRRTFYDESAAKVPADAIVCRHVIEHVPDPLKMLRSIRAALRHNPRARVFFETPCVDWILRHRVAWDFFYEHCSLFTAASLTAAFERAGFTVQSCDHVFDGQYLWLEAVPSGVPQIPRDRPGITPSLAGLYAATETSRNQQWVSTVTALSRSGGIALWGAGAKGVTFANLVDAHAKLIHAVVDINPGKQGHYLPGSGHEIVSPEALLKRPVKTVLVLNPNYVPEITAWLNRQGSIVQVVDLQSPQRQAA